MYDKLRNFVRKLAGEMTAGAQANTQYWPISKALWKLMKDGAVG